MNESNRYKCKIICKSLAFIAIGIVCFGLLQNIIVTKWNWPTWIENNTKKYQAFEKQEKNTNQVLYLGTSHILYAFQPMEIYKKTGITGYNLASGNQNIILSYFILKNALRTQSPQVVLLDSNVLMRDMDKDVSDYWWYVIPSIKWEGNDLFELAKEYSSYGVEAMKDDCESRFFSVVFPIYRFHDSWKVLSEYNFTDGWDNTNYFSMGSFIESSVVEPYFSREDMMEIFNKMKNEQVEKSIIIDDGVISDYEKIDSSFLNCTVYPDNEKWFKKIVELCEENGIRLILASMPAQNVTNLYASSMTTARHNAIEQIAEKYKIDYLDYMNEVDCGFNSQTDFRDDGMHVNFEGAKKISENFGYLLSDIYGITPNVTDQFEKNLGTYNKVCSIAKYHATDSLDDYLDMLANIRTNSVILISARDDFCNALELNDINRLKKLGLFANVEIENELRYGEAYVAVIDGANTLFEGISNRTISKDLSFDGKDGSTINVKLISSGWLNDDISSIRINDMEYSPNGRGINIIVFDKDTQQVIDSVTFDTHIEGNSRGYHYHQIDIMEQYWRNIE